MVGPSPTRAPARRQPATWARRSATVRATGRGGLGMAGLWPRVSGASMGAWRDAPLTRDSRKGFRLRIRVGRRRPQVERVMPQANVIVVGNEKGGAGKSTIA